LLPQRSKHPREMVITPKVSTLIFERSRSNSSPLEKTRSKLANPVELSWDLAGVSTGVASFNRNLLIGFFWTGFALNGIREAA